MTKEQVRKKPCLARRIIGYVLIALTVLLTVDVVVVMTRKISTVVLKDTYQKIFIYQLVMCAILIVFALDVRFGIFSWMRNKAVRVIGWILRVVFIVLSAVILFFCGKVVAGGLINNSVASPYAIVLGMALEDGKPVKDLLLRLETAKDYLAANDGAILILTGGNADGSGKTEAEVMHDILMEDGVQEESMYLEDRAETTDENFANVAQMVGTDEPIVLITSNYHEDRAYDTARKAGFTNLTRLPAPSEFLTYGSNMMWEVVMEINNLL